jgi:sulfate adenylyltransferase subunit 1 (EFTu-like GTPase family)
MSARDRDAFPVVVTGSVCAGKSTLAGQLARLTQGGPRAAPAFALYELPARTAPLTLGNIEAGSVIVVVDALAGLTDDDRRALDAAAGSGQRHVIVAVNRMDLAGFEYEVFKGTRAQVARLAERFGADGVAVVPVTAVDGGNIVAPDSRIDWYDGGTLAELLGIAAFRRPVGALAFAVAHW